MSKMAEELKQRAEQDKIIKSLSSKNDELELRNSQLASKLADTEFKYNSVAATNDNMQSELAKCSGVLR